MILFLLITLILVTGILIYYTVGILFYLLISFQLLFVLFVIYKLSVRKQVKQVKRLASLTYTRMEVYYKKHFNNAMCASLYGFDSGLNQYLTNNDLSSFLVNEEPVWLLGEKYSTINQLKELLDDFRSRIWITYRKNFASIGGNGPTSDQGWGCMARCGQMVLAQAFILHYLGKDWRWIGCKKYYKDEESKNKMDFDSINYEEEQRTSSDDQESNKFNADVIKLSEQEYLNFIKSDQEHEIYIKILKQFQDKKTSQYSIHQIALMGATEDKPVGTWFGPNTIAQTLKKVSSFDHTNNITIHVSLDNVIIIDEIHKKCIINNETDPSSKISWRPLILFIPLRLGLSEINPIYFDSIKQTFRTQQTLGIIGGKPNHALYFVGYVNNEFIYLDPHKTQPTIDLDELAPLDSFCDDLSYHCKTANRMDFNLIDPSIALCFFFKTKDEFDNWCKLFKELFEKNDKQSLFELSETRMKQWACAEAEEGVEYKDYDMAMNSMNDNLIQASEATEHSSYDEEEFELLG